MSGRLENDSFKLSELKLNLGNMADKWFASYTEYQTHYAKSQRKNSVNGIAQCSRPVRKVFRYVSDQTFYEFYIEDRSSRASR